MFNAYNSIYQGPNDKRRVWTEKRTRHLFTMAKSGKPLSEIFDEMEGLTEVQVKNKIYQLGYRISGERVFIDKEM